MGQALGEIRGHQSADKSFALTFRGFSSILFFLSLGFSTRSVFLTTLSLMDITFTSEFKTSFESLGWFIHVKHLPSYKDGRNKHFRGIPTVLYDLFRHA